MAQNSPELPLLKISTITAISWLLPLDFTSFSTMAFLEATPFFTAWLFLIRYHFLLYLYTAKLVALGFF